MDPSQVPAPKSKPVVLRGACSCGQVTFTSGATPIAVTVCHCTTCRKLSGNTVLTFGLFHNDALEWYASDEFAKPSIRIAASELAMRGFCNSCSTPLFMKYHCRPDGTSVTMGLIDNELSLSSIPVPKEHIFLAEKAFWVDLGQDTSAKHLGFNEPFQARLKEWYARGKPQRSDIPRPLELQKDIWIYGGRPQFSSKI